MTLLDADIGTDDPEAATQAGRAEAAAVVALAGSSAAVGPFDGSSEAPTALPRPGEDAPAPVRRAPSAIRQLLAVSCSIVTAVALGLTVQLTVVSGLQHRAAQQRHFDDFRGALAEGTAPVGPVDPHDPDGALLAPGTPVALLDIPAIHVHEVVGEGSTSSVLMDGPGHRRDTPFPGQAGTSVVLGRATAYGGPFGAIDELSVGDTITTTTGQGVATYRVTDARRAGDPSPAAVTAGHGRLVLVTATGAPYLPSGVLRVDADLVSTAFAPSATALPTADLPPAERPLASDPARTWALVLWLQALVVAAIGAVWAWYRWGRLQAWIVFGPLVALTASCVADELLRRLPNLL